MILECPACHAQFKVPDGAIPPAGRIVRCSSCKHQWHATIAVSAPPAPPPPAAAVPEPAPLPMDHSFLEALTQATESPDATVAAQIEPAVVPNVERASNPKPSKPAASAPLPSSLKPFKIAAPLLAASWLIMALFAYFPSWANAPVLSGIYSVMGVVPTEGVILTDIAMQRESEGQRTRFLVSGNIVNQEASERVVPSVRVRMISPTDEVVWEREYEVNKALKPGEIYPFRITNAETSFGHNVATLVVDMGHPLQLMFR